MSKKTYYFVVFLKTINFKFNIRDFFLITSAIFFSKIWTSIDFFSINSTTTNLSFVISIDLFFIMTKNFFCVILFEKMKTLSFHLIFDLIKIWLFSKIFALKKTVADDVWKFRFLNSFCFSIIEFFDFNVDFDVSFFSILLLSF